MAEGGRGSILYDFQIDTNKLLLFTTIVKGRVSSIHTYQDHENRPKALRNYDIIKVIRPKNVDILPYTVKNGKKKLKIHYKSSKYRKILLGS